MNAPIQMLDNSLSERAVLGAVLVDASLLSDPTISQLRPQTYVDEAHVLAWHTVLTLHADGCPCDATAVCAELQQRGLVDQAGGLAYLLKLIREAGTGSDAWFHADILLRAERRRKAQQVLLEAGAQLTDGDPTTIIEMTRERLLGLSDNDRTLIKLLTAEDLDNGDFRLSYHIDGVLVKGQPGLWGATYKGMKTSTVCDAAISVASGTWFLNKFSTHVAPVVMFSGESGMGTLQETCRRVCAARKLELSKLENFRITDFLPQLNNRRDIAETRRVLKDFAGGIVFFDPAYLMVGGDDAANVAKMGEQLRVLSHLGADLDLTVVLVHHLRKTIDSQEPPELQWFSGAGYAEWARQWFLLNRRERYEEGSGKHLMWITYGGSAGHSGAWGLDIFEGTRERIGGRFWDCRVNPITTVRQDQNKERVVAAETRKEASRRATEERYAEKVTGALETATEPLTRTKLAAATQLSDGNTKDTIARLLDAGTIEEVPVTIKGRVHQAYKLSTRQHPTTSDNSSLSGGGEHPTTTFPIYREVVGCLPLAPSEDESVSKSLSGALSAWSAGGQQTGTVVPTEVPQ